MRGVIFVLTFSVLAGMAIYNATKIFRQNSDIDDLRILVQPLLPLINPHSMLTYQSDDPSRELFYMILMAVMPVVRDQNRQLDAILPLNDAGSNQPVKIHDSASYSVIASNIHGRHKISLIILNQ